MSPNDLDIANLPGKTLAGPLKIYPLTLYPWLLYIVAPTYLILFYSFFSDGL